MARFGVRAGPLFVVSEGRTGCAPWIVAFVVLCLIAAAFVDHPWIALAGDGRADRGGRRAGAAGPQKAAPAVRHWGVTKQQGRA